MKETLAHKEAFEYYYILGKKRSFRLVESRYKVSNKTVSRWSKAFNWQERIEQRDMENSKRIKDKTDDLVVNTKADYRTEIKVQLGILKAMLNEVIKDIKDGKIIKVGSTETLKNVISSYERLCRLDLLLMGEPTSFEKLNVDWGLITDEQLDDYIDTLSKGGKVQLPIREKEKGDKN